jgi:hypothetical protein
MRFVVDANFKFFDYVTDVYLIFIKNSCFLLVKAEGPSSHWLQDFQIYANLFLSLNSFMLL